MRWKNVVAGLALAVVGAVGCKQQCFLAECDYKHYHDLGLPANLDTRPTGSISPITGDVPAPATVLNPEREPRHLSLAEAICIALENDKGNWGGRNLGCSGPNGQQDEVIATLPTVTLGRQAAEISDNFRVLALGPAFSGADIESSLSKFDVRWTSSLTWNTTDRPVGTVLDTFQALNRANSIQTNDAALFTGLVKPLPTGGVAGITFRTDYQISNLNPRVNPSYRPTLQFAFDQPLLQGFGVEINQLRNAHPGVTPQFSQNQPFSTGGGVQGILITRLSFDANRTSFEVNKATLLAQLEAAYWNLYAQYWNLFSREQALRQAYEAWKILKYKFEAGSKAITDFAQTRVQYELFRSQRIAALGQVLDAERQLRGFMGMAVEDGQRLVPIDAPTLAPYQPDWTTSLSEALSLRPELEILRIQVKARQLNIINAKNFLLPDLRFVANYDINGIGTRLDGPEGDNALRSLASAKFNNYGLGLRMEVPLGYREAHARLRQARLELASWYFHLDDSERRVATQLACQFRRLFETHQQIQANRAQREAAAQQLEARFKEYLAGRGTLDILLEAQRFWADALRDEYRAISDYNIALAGFEFAKGTLLQHDNVVIAEGPLPQCAQVRAVDHERERSKALVLRERANPICPDASSATTLPALPPDGAPSIPAVLEGKRLTPPVPDGLPPGPDTTLRSPSVGAAPPSGTIAVPMPAMKLPQTPAALPVNLGTEGPAARKPTLPSLDTADVKK